MNRRVRTAFGAESSWRVRRARRASALSVEDERFLPAAGGVIAEEEAQGLVLVDFEDSGTDGAAARVFEAGDVALDDGVIVDAGDFSPEVFAGPGSVADVGMAVEVQA